MGIVEDTFAYSDKQKLIESLNKIIGLCEPITYGEFNKYMYEIVKGSLDEVEDKENKIGIVEKDGRVGISTLTIIATITDFLCGDRLAFIVSKDDDSGIIEGFKWYSECKSVEEEK